MYLLAEFVNVFRWLSNVQLMRQLYEVKIGEVKKIV